MSILDDNENELDPSINSDLDEQTAAVQPDAQAEAAASSPATGENEDKDLLSVVRDVVKESREPSEPASPAENVETKVDDQDAKKEDDEDYSDVPFNKHPRFQQLLRKAKTYEADAGRYRNVETFLTNNNLGPDEAADVLIAAALAKTDPAKCWEQIKPWVQSVLVAAGEVLPQDLQQRVAAGELSREAAMELSRTKARAQSFEAQQSFREQQEQRRTQEAAVQALTGAAQSWEQDRLAKDPNFGSKTTALQKEILFLQRQEGRPNTPEGVRDQLNRAYKAVNDSLPRATPAPAPRKPVQPVRGGNVAGNQQPENMSTLDIVRANRRQG
jgi:hypothetical protein